MIGFIRKLAGHIRRLSLSERLPKRLVHSRRLAQQEGERVAKLSLILGIRVHQRECRALLDSFKSSRRTLDQRRVIETGTPSWMSQEIVMTGRLFLI